MFIIIIISILLCLMLFATWKAPSLVKEIGLIALVSGLLFTLLKLHQLFSALSEVAGSREDITGIFDLISPNVLFNGLAADMIPLIYGIIIYLISLIIRMVRKPRI